MKITKQQLKQIIKEEITKLREWNRTFKLDPKKGTDDFEALDHYLKQLGEGYYGNISRAMGAVRSLWWYPQLEDDQSRYYLGQTLEILQRIKDKGYDDEWNDNADLTRGFFAQVWLRVPRPEGYKADNTPTHGFVTRQREKESL